MRRAQRELLRVCATAAREEERLLEAVAAAVRSTKKERERF